MSDNFTFDLNKNPSLEAQIASLSDDIAYIAHDFDDGIRAEILEIKKIANLSDLFDFIDFKYMQSLDKKVARNYFTRKASSSATERELENGLLQLLCFHKRISFVFQYLF